MSQRSNLRFTKDHEWAVLRNGRVVVGITDYAADELGDIVFVELPEVGDQVEAGEPFGSIESVKAVSDLLSPITGQVVAINMELADAPETVNSDPLAEGWMIEVEPDDPAELQELMTADEYDAFLEEIE